MLGNRFRCSLTTGCPTAGNAFELEPIRDVRSAIGSLWHHETHRRNVMASSKNTKRSHLSRRQFIVRAGGFAGAAAVLSACGGAIEPVVQSTSAPVGETAAPAVV